MQTIKWRWWYPEGCIQCEGLNEFPTDESGGEWAAAEIADWYLTNNPPDDDGGLGPIEIVEPEGLAGVYEVHIDWSPSASCTRR